MFASMLAARFVSLCLLRSGEDSKVQVFETETLTEHRGMLAEAFSLFLDTNLTAFS